MLTSPVHILEVLFDTIYTDSTGCLLFRLPALQHPRGYSSEISRPALHDFPNALASFASVPGSSTPRIPDLQSDLPPPESQPQQQKPGARNHQKHVSPPALPDRRVYLPIPAAGRLQRPPCEPQRGAGGALVRPAL